MTRHDLINKFENNTLGGYEAQRKMEHLARFSMMQKAPKIPANHRSAAVMCLLYPAENDWNVVFIVRPSYDGAHSGQIAFAGGGIEPEDENMQATALRETEEEIGVAPHLIEIISPLTPLFIPVSNFMVYPFVGILEKRPIFTPQASEVVEILEIPLNIFRNEENIKITTLKLEKGITLEKVPYYDLNGRVLWGATAMMMAEFIDIVFEQNSISSPTPTT